MRGPAASERTGRRGARQPQSSRGLFQTSESADSAKIAGFKPGFSGPASKAAPRLLL